MTRARALALAAQAVNAASTEHEANTSARILAKLIHENPDLLAPVPWVAIGDPPEGASAIDPIVGFAVREAVGLAGEFFRDFMRAKDPAERVRYRAATSCRAKLERAGVEHVFFCKLPEGHTGRHATQFGESWESPQDGAPRPGPRKAASPKRVRPRGRP